MATKNTALIGLGNLLTLEAIPTEKQVMSQQERVISQALVDGVGEYHAVTHRGL